MKKNYLEFVTSVQRYFSLETATFLAAVGYGLAILLLCMLR